MAEVKLLPSDETNDKLDRGHKPCPEFINNIGNYLIDLLSGYHSRVSGGVWAVEVIKISFIMSFQLHSSSCFHDRRNGSF